MIGIRKAFLIILALAVIPACGGSGDTTIVQQSGPQAPAPGTLVGLTADGLTLVFVDPAVPHIPLRILPLTLPAATTLTTIAFRPLTKTLYAHAVNGRTYEIDLVTGGALSIGNTAFFLLNAPVLFSMSFNPVTDIFRMVDNQENNVTVDPISNNFTGHTTLSAPVTAVAHTNNFVGAATTTLFGLDNTQVLRIGGVNGAPSPNGGAVSVIGPHGIPLGAGSPSGFAITPGGTAYAVRTSGLFVAELWTIDLAGVAAPTKIGPFGTGVSILGMAVVP